MKGHLITIALVLVALAIFEAAKPYVFKTTVSA